MFKKNLLQSCLVIGVIALGISANQSYAQDDSDINYNNEDLIRVPCEYNVVTTHERETIDSNKTTDTEEEKSPQDIKARELYKKGINALSNKEFDKASSFFKRSLKEDSKNIKAYNNLGIAYRNQGLLDKAIDTFDEALKLAPDNAITYQLLGAAYLYKEDYNLALKNFEEFKRLDPQNPEVYFSIGNALALEKKYSDSNYNYLKAIDLYTDEQADLKSDAYFNVGTNYFKQNNFDEAINYFKKALTANSNNKDALYFAGLSNVYKTPRNLEEAKKYLLKADKSGYKLPPLIQKMISKDE